MKLMYKKTATIFLSFLLLFGAVNFVLASEAGDSLTNGLITLFTNVLKFSALLSACVFAFGAILYMFGMGIGRIIDTKKGTRGPAEAIDWMKAGILGLLIVMCSWLIAYTINPKLLIFDINGLTEFGLGVSQGTNSAVSPFEPKKLFYNEIPIGILSEELLARKVNCYEFDMNGDPVAGELVEPDNGKEIRGPTYVEYDRVECYLKLVDAVEKKSLIAEILSKKIMAKMDECSCAVGTCKNTCSQPSADSKTNEGCKLNESESGCEGACTQASTAGCLNSDIPRYADYWAPNDTYMSSCPENIRNQIQGYSKKHGDGEEKKVEPFKIGMTKECENCSSNIEEKYYGLDEFYTNKSNFSNIVEKTVQVDEKDLEYIDISCTACAYSCEKNETKCEKDYQTCLTNRQKCLAETPWGKLNLVEQISYLSEKLEKAKQAIKKDLETLAKAESDVSACALPQSYIDLRKREESSDENFYKFEIKKTYQDPNTEEPFDVAKYCNGFNYSNSSCDQTCSNICPTTKENIECYEKCESCDPKAKNYKDCLQKRNECINDCYKSRKCINTNDKDINDYKECVTKCDKNCVDLCSVKYLKCSKEYESCKSTCEDNSTCLLNNIDSCILNTDSVSVCTNKETDEEVKKCIEINSLCKSGSNQNSGYSECLKDQKQSDFSSSYLWQNQDKQVCKNPYEAGFITPSGASGFCVRAYPETSKCPASSDCPECSCNLVEANPEFSVEGKLEPHELDLCKEGEDKPGAPSSYPKCQIYESETTNQDTKEYRIVGPDCNEYSYNDDPLTFYCRQDWWNEPETKREDAVGNGMICPNGTETPEIPVGNMVDNAEKWADNFLVLAGKASDTAKKIVDALKVIGNDQRYCQCNSKYISGNPICKTCCNFKEKQEYTDKTTGKTITIPATCNIDACKGNSCQGIIIKLEEVVNGHTEIKGALIELYIDLLADSRTDVLKELTYSRNQVNVCSSTQNLVGQQKTRMLNCQRILDDIVPPDTSAKHKITIEEQEIYHYCRGVMAGQILKKGPIMDNWFCCETAIDISAQSQKILDKATENFLDSGGAGAGY